VRTSANGYAQSSHPGIIQVYLDPNSLNGCELAVKLSVAASTLNRILALSALTWLYVFPRPTLSSLASPDSRVHHL